MHDRDVLYLTYSGQSMYPTLQAPCLLEVVPYNECAVRVGDVICFKYPDMESVITHRVVRITPEGIYTRGDNNSEGDNRMLATEEILGRVVAAWSGPVRREVPGGRSGALAKYFTRSGVRLDRRISPRVHRLYQALARCGILARLMPPCLRPKIFVFRDSEKKYFRLAIMGHTIAWYSDLQDDWVIRRPFRLLVSERLLGNLQNELSENNHKGP